MCIIGIDEASRRQRGRASSHPHKYIIGIDEAGRGPLAGPVVVAGVYVSREMQADFLRRGIRDSKKLTAKKREEWFRFLTAHPKIRWSVTSVWPRVIDRINIAQAANLGARRVYAKLCSDLRLVQEQFVQLDGGLVLPPPILHEVIIKGDEKIPAIAAASIIAKVTRDRIMLRLHKKYPQYRFDLHKGYGTELHREMIRLHGPSRTHRQSFRMGTHLPNQFVFSRVQVWHHQ